MALKKYVSNAWEDIGDLKRYSSGAWTSCESAKAYKNSAWQEVWGSNVATITFSKLTSSDGKVEISNDSKKLCYTRYTGYSNSEEIHITILLDESPPTFDLSFTAEGAFACTTSSNTTESTNWYAYSGGTISLTEYFTWSTGDSTSSTNTIAPYIGTQGSSDAFGTFVTNVTDSSGYNDVTYTKLEIIIYPRTSTVTYTEIDQYIYI